ncbi:MAG: anti-sigma factor antagonist [Gammaproteobacteria bacterium]|jgi:anti-sigma B factor antagonist|nr:MAG: anti-sigma factor antagonist [Gammaproteobacteria bacterium]
MKHEILKKQGASIVVFTGEIDLESSPAARETLLKCFEHTGNVIVDLSDVSYIDSSGVASLVEALQAAKKQGSQFALAAVSEPTRRVLELARLDKVFTLYDSVEQALENQA